MIAVRAFSQTRAKITTDSRLVREGMQMSLWSFLKTRATYCSEDHAMTMKHVGLVGLVVLSLGVESLVLGSRCPATDPINALAAHFMIGTHCPNVPVSASTPEKSNPLVASELHISDVRW